MVNTITVVKHVPSQIPIGQGSATGRSCCCPCIHTEFLCTQPGICKIGEVIFGAFSLSLAVGYGIPVWMLVGPALGFFITTAAAAVLGAGIFTFAYIISLHTYRVVRSTVLETVQNIVASILFTCSSSFLMTQISLILWPMYIIIPFFQAYPALMGAAVCGYASAFIHAVDAFYACRHLYNSRC